MKEDTTGAGRGGPQRRRADGRGGLDREWVGQYRRAYALRPTREVASRSLGSASIANAIEGGKLHSHALEEYLRDRARERKAAAGPKGPRTPRVVVDSDDDAFEDDENGDDPAGGEADEDGAAASFWSPVAAGSPQRWEDGGRHATRSAFVRSCQEVLRRQLEAQRATAAQLAGAERRFKAFQLHQPQRAIAARAAREALAARAHAATMRGIVARRVVNPLTRRLLVAAAVVSAARRLKLMRDAARTVCAAVRQIQRSWCAARRRFHAVLERTRTERRACEAATHLRVFLQEVGDDGFFLSYCELVALHHRQKNE